MRPRCAADAVRRAEGGAGVVDAGARQGRNFAPERADTSVNVFEASSRMSGHCS